MLCGWKFFCLVPHVSSVCVCVFVRLFVRLLALAQALNCPPASSYFSDREICLFTSYQIESTRTPNGCMCVCVLALQDLNHMIRMCIARNKFPWLSFKKCLFICFSALLFYSTARSLDSMGSAFCCCYCCRVAALKSAIILMPQIACK